MWDDVANVKNNNVKQCRTVNKLLANKDYAKKKRRNKLKNKFCMVCKNIDKEMGRGGGEGVVSSTLSSR